MKTRLIWRTVVGDKDVQWWGTCHKWVAEALLDGYKVISRERVLWVGKAPGCSACEWGFH